MNTGKYIFAQLIEFLPQRIFDRIVMKYEGNKYVKHFTCWNQLLVLYKKVIGNYRPLLDGERYLTDREVAQILKVSRRTLQEYRNDGVLPYVLLGGKVLYRESDLERVLESCYHPAYKR